MNAANESRTRTDLVREKKVSGERKKEKKKEQEERESERCSNCIFTYSQLSQLLSRTVVKFRENLKSLTTSTRRGEFCTDKKKKKKKEKRTK